MDNDDLMDLLIEVQFEVQRADDLFPAFHSPHDAYGVMAEELAEFFDIVRVWRPASKLPEQWYPHEKEMAHRELVQIAAMAIRSINSLGV